MGQKIHPTGFRLPVTRNGTAFTAQRAIARFLLASEPERQSRSFESWGRNDDGNRLNNFEW